MSGIEIFSTVIAFAAGAVSVLTALFSLRNRIRSVQRSGEVKIITTDSSGKIIEQEVSRIDPETLQEIVKMIRVSGSEASGSKPSGKANDLTPPNPGTAADA